MVIDKNSKAEKEWLRRKAIQDKTYTGRLKALYDPKGSFDFGFYKHAHKNTSKRFTWFNWNTYEGEAAIWKHNDTIGDVYFRILGDAKEKGFKDPVTDYTSNLMYNVTYL